MNIELPVLVRDFAEAIEVVDRRSPVAINQRSKEPFQPGLGPHTEAATISLLMKELAGRYPDRYAAFALGVPYPKIKRQKCDLCIGTTPLWTWAIEVKLVRFLGDNGRPNDNILMHVLSPYAEHRSALTDCSKLLSSGIHGRKGILIYGFEHDDWPLGPAVDAFEVLAGARVRLGQRAAASFEGLVHPIHRRGIVFAWELLPRGDES